MKEDDEKAIDNFDIGLDTRMLFRNDDTEV